jgi:hypothetical protein
MANPFGRITNSDLEQAGLLGQVSVISQNHEVSYSTIATGSNNTPAVARITKGAVTSDAPAAHLCNYTLVPTSASTDTATCLTSSQETPMSWQTMPHACISTSQTPPSLITSNRYIRSPNHGDCSNSHKKVLCS